MNAPTRVAIEAGHPLRWEADGVGGFGVKLVATTYTWENGHSRERTLMHTFNAETARKLHGEVEQLAGTCTGLTPRRFTGSGGNGWKSRWGEGCKLCAP